jgi:ATP-dependent Clp protease ATP-binding subunit ClpC
MERFTGPAKRMVSFARKEAQARNNRFADTTHLLLGLLHDLVVVAALRTAGITPENVRELLDSTMSRDKHRPRSRILFTPGAAKALDLSHREASNLGARGVEPEHILLGLLREGEGIAAQLLVKQGATLDRMREFIAGERASSPEQAEPDIPYEEPHHPAQTRVFTPPGAYQIGLPAT